MIRPLATVALIAVIALVAGFSTRIDRPISGLPLDENPSAIPSEETQAPGELDSGLRPFDDQLLQIANDYNGFQRIGADYHWANEACAPGFAFSEPELLFSSSPDVATHGRKLYALFASLPTPTGSYVVKGQPNPVGQVLVKEAWVPELTAGESLPEDAAYDPLGSGSSDPLLTGRDRGSVPFAGHDAKRFRPRQKSALFIMFKLDPETPGTDEGWVYGTVTADGQQVTSVGRVTSCMNCHREAPHDRLFGLSDDQE